MNLILKLVFSVSFIAQGISGQDLCELVWRTPEGCTDDSNCAFQSFLRYDTDTIHFELRSANGRDAASPTGLKWVGIGLSLDNQMANSDCLMGWVEEDGSFDIYDRWAVAQIMPNTDQAQGGNDDLDDKNGEFVDGITVLEFSRPRNTGDQFDIPIVDNQGLYVFHVFDGGNMENIETGDISYHGNSADNIFIQEITSFPPCETDPTEPPVVPTEPPVVPTEPPVVPTEPPVVPTEPPVIPTEPPVVPTEPPLVTDPTVVQTDPPLVKTTTKKNQRPGGGGRGGHGRGHEGAGGGQRGRRGST